MAVANLFGFNATQSKVNSITWGTARQRKPVEPKETNTTLGRSRDIDTEPSFGSGEMRQWYFRKGGRKKPLLFIPFSTWSGKHLISHKTAKLKIISTTREGHVALWEGQVLRAGSLTSCQFSSPGSASVCALPHRHMWEKPSLSSLLGGGTTARMGPSTCSLSWSSRFSALSISCFLANAGGSQV